MPNKKSEKKIPTKLNEEQQQQSWQIENTQIEILIASGFIFFLFNLPDFLTNYFIDVNESKIIQAEGTILFFGSYIFARALLIGFSIILFLRALWLAFLGINYAFPQGINYSKLSYSNYFKEKTKHKTSVKNRIIKLEKVCSLTYSVTIILTLLTIGMFLLMSLIFYVIYYLAPSFYVPEFGYVIIIVLFLMMLGIFDLIFFGFLKRFQIISKIYYPLYKLFKWLSLSFTYSQEWLTFISNTSRWKVYGLFLSYFVLSFFISSSEISERLGSDLFFQVFSVEDRNYTKLPSFQQVKNNRYENMLDSEKRIMTACIQSDIIKDSYLKVFVVYQKWFDSTLDSLFKKNDVILKLRQKSYIEYMKNDSLIQKTLNEFFITKIDDQEFSDSDWYFHDHSITGEKGFLTYLPLDKLVKGKHTLFINRLHLVEKNLKVYGNGVIHFYIN